MAGPEARAVAPRPSGGSNSPQAGSRAVALKYAALGWPVFPCLDKSPAYAKGTHPVWAPDPIEPAGHTRATTDAAVITEHWPEGANINVGTPGVPGLFIYDVDVPKARGPYANHTPEERQAIGRERYEHVRALFPFLCWVRTPRGGHHGYAVRWPAGSAPPPTGTYPIGLRDGKHYGELRGNHAAYVILPGGRTSDGTYTLIDVEVPDIKDVPIAGADLIAFTTPPPTSSNGAAHALDFAVGAGGATKTVHGDPEVYARGALEGIARRLAETKTNRNVACFDSALNIGRWHGGFQRAGLPGFNEANICAALIEAMIANGDYAEDPSKAEATIRNGLRAGMASAYSVTHLPTPSVTIADASRDPTDPGLSDADAPPEVLAALGGSLNDARAAPAKLGAAKAAKGELVPTGKPSGPARHGRIVSLDTIEPESVDHLDEGRPALGKLTLMVGDAGTGKTHIALAIAANITRGKPPFPTAVSPRGRYREPANVLALIGEDGLADTIRPRFDAAGGDPGRFFALIDVVYTSTDDVTHEAEVDLTQLDVIEEALIQHRPALVLVDPVQVYLGPGADMHRANEVRAALKGVAKLAEKYHAALLILGHLNKSTGGGKAIYRALGSIDFVAIARSVLVVGEHNGEMVIAHAKANLSSKAPTLTFSLDHGVLTWTGFSSATADELTSGEARPYEKPRQAEATGWVKGLLRAGPRKARDMKRLAKEAGIAWRTVQRASKGMGVLKRKVGTPGAESHWQWELPD